MKITNSEKIAINLKKKINELAKIIVVVDMWKLLKLAWIFKSFLFSFGFWGLALKLKSIASEIQEILDNTDKTSQKTIEVLEIILKLKRENPEVYKDIFKILDELLEICEENKELIHEKLKDFD